MENIKITKEQYFIDSIDKWCVGIYCNDAGFNVWTGGFFHKNLEIAEKKAMESFRKSIAFQREVKKCNSPEKQELSVFA